jgi:hypothetical protein
MIIIGTMKIRSTPFYGIESVVNAVLSSAVVLRHPFVGVIVLLICYYPHTGLKEMKSSAAR